MLKIQASCFFLLGSDRERQSLHRDLLRRIQHKSAPWAALPAAARPGGDRWRIVPAFLHRASAGAEAAARRVQDLCSAGAGEGRDGPRLAEEPALPDGAAAGEIFCAGAALSCPTALRTGLLRSRRQPQSAASSSCSRSPAVAGAPWPSAPAAAPAAASTRGATSAGAPSADPRGHGSSNTGASTSAPKAEAFLGAGFSAGGCRQRVSQGCGEPERSPRPSPPPPLARFWGRPRLTSVTRGERPALFSRLMCRGGGRGLLRPLSPPLVRLPVGPNAAGGGDLPGVRLRRRALPASSGRNLFTSNYQKMNVLRTALLICYN